MSNKKDWSALSMSERADFIRDIAIPNNITNRKDIINLYNSFSSENKFTTGGSIETDEYGYPANITPAIIEADYPRETEVWKRADASNANIVQRLKQGSSRVTIQDWEDPRKVATHKMMSAGKYAVGNVQNINGQLFDFTDPKHGFKDPDRAAIDNAIKRGDYVEFDTEGDARYFAEHYKKHYNSFSGEEDTKTTEEKTDNSFWKKVGSTAYDILELLDPTGVSSWATSEGDLRQAINAYKNGNGSIGDIALETVGALPLIGKVGKAIKLGKGVSKVEKIVSTAAKAADNAKKIDTLLELIPGVKKAATGTQAVTGTLMQAAADALNLSSDARRYTNIGTNIINNGNTIKDIIDVLDVNDTNQTDLEDINATGEYKSYWDASNKEKRGLPLKRGKYSTMSKRSVKDAHTHYDVIEARYKKLIPAMRKEGFSTEEISRLSPFLITQMILEGGWNVTNEDNNFGGMLDPKTRKKIKFNSEEDFYKAYLNNLDKRWGDAYLGKGKGWRNAEDLQQYADIVNREDLGLYTQEDWKEYNRTHPKAPAYIYTPLWENNNTGLMSAAKFGGIKDRTFGLIELLRLRERMWDEYAKKHNILKK